MSDLPQQPSPTPRKQKNATATWLRVLGTLVLLLVILGGAAQILGRTDVVDSNFLREIGAFTLYVAAALVAGGLLVGLSALLKALRDLHHAFLRIERYQYEQTEAYAASQDPATVLNQGATEQPSAKSAQVSAAATEPIPWRDVLSLLSDIRDTSMLTESQRVEKRERMVTEELERAESRIKSITAEGEFGQAREAARQLLARFPNEKKAQALVEYVETSREKSERNDVESCKQQVTDLITISAWGRAREIAQQLQLRHPDSTEARQLILRIEKEYQQFEGEQRRRMYTEAQRFTSRKRWEEALAAAQTFINRFPNCEESEALRMQLPTLEKNAEIGLRLRLESQIMEYARQGRYIEAVNLARQVIRDYPDSPQAEVLKDQLPRLEDLAENPDAPPARVQPE